MRKIFSRREQFILEDQNSYKNKFNNVSKAKSFKKSTLSVIIGADLKRQFKIYAANKGETMSFMVEKCKMTREIAKRV